MQGDAYSRLIAVLKIALPLVALAILSTLFLLSSRIDPAETIPFAKGDVIARIRGEQVTAPLFSGVTADGDSVRLTADRIVTESAGKTQATSPSALLDFATGGSMSVAARTGTVELARDLARLDGDVLIESTLGYRVRSDQVTAQLSTLHVESPGEVQATGPLGDFTAGAMIVADTETGTHWRFTGGVKLIYDPAESE